MVDASHHHRIADLLAAISVALAGVTLADVDHVVSILAGLAAIVAAGAATYYHLERVRHVKRAQLTIETFEGGGGE